MPERVSDKYCNNSAVTLLHDNVIMKQNLLKTLGKPDFNMFFLTQSFLTAVPRIIHYIQNYVRHDTGASLKERFDGKVANSIKNPWSCWPDSPCGRCW